MARARSSIPPKVVPSLRHAVLTLLVGLFAASGARVQTDVTIGPAAISDGNMIVSNRPAPTGIAAEWPVFEGPLMGQAPPGRTAEVFAPGAICTDGWELEAVFATGMREFDFVTDRGDERPTILISFRHEDGSWGPALNMGPDVNSEKDDFYATVTHDGRFLMFDRTMARDENGLDVDIDWVDAGIIEELEAENRASR